MSVTVTDYEIASLLNAQTENKELREQLEKASTENEDIKGALRQSRKDMTTLSQELLSIKMLETKIGLILHSLTKKRTHLEETLTKAIHSFDELLRQV